MSAAEDRRYMRMALRLAERGRGDTAPNPVVGAVLVRGGRVIARGWHRRAGLPHAEVEALARIGHRAPGATLYVTLEPCCHTGRTGPCTRSILEAGIARVVVGCVDQNPRVRGRGIARLRRAGVRVEVGCLEAECRAQNRAFFRWIRDGRPQVTLKAALTLDGIIAPAAQRPGKVRWVTGPAARAAAHELRAARDAVLVGAGTVIADDPRLTARTRLTARQPLRVVLDGNLRTPRRAKLLRADTRPPLLVGARASARRARGLERAGAEVLLLPGARDGRVSLSALLRALARRGVQSLLVEGGSQVLGAFVAAGLVDEVAFFIAPRLAGRGVPVVQGAGPGLEAALALGTMTVRAIGEDILVTAEVQS